MYHDNMPTTREIAKESGLSHATVALALKDSPRISPTTREKVKRVAEEMGWRPNLLVSAYQNFVASGRVKDFEQTLAWLNVSKTPNSWVSNKTLEAIKDKATKRGWKIETFSLRNFGMTKEEKGEPYALKVLSVLKARGIKCIILPHRSRLRFSKIPNIAKDFIIVSMFDERYAENAGQTQKPKQIAHYVNPDSFSNVQMLCNKLWEIGYNRIALCLKGWDNWTTHGTVVGGYFAASCPVERFPVYILGDEAEKLKAPPANFINWVEHVKPDAIICGNNILKGWLEILGMKIPQDIGIAHFQLGPAEEGWSGIDIHVDRLGAIAFDILSHHYLNNQFGEPTVAKNLHTYGFWVDGETTLASLAPGNRQTKKDWNPVPANFVQNPNLFHSD